MTSAPSRYSGWLLLPGVSVFVFGDTAAHCSSDENMQEFGTHQGQRPKLMGATHTHTHTQMYALKWVERQMHASLPASTSSGWWLFQERTQHSDTHPPLHPRVFPSGPFLSPVPFLSFILTMRPPLLSCFLPPFTVCTLGRGTLESRLVEKVQLR